MNRIKYFVIGSISAFAIQVHANNISFLNDVLPESERKNFEISISHAKFDDGLDLLDYTDKLSGTRPESAKIDEWSLSYRIKDKFKITLANDESEASAVRNTIPKQLKTFSQTDYMSISYLHTGEHRTYDFEIFYKETEQDDVTIDCYQSGAVVIGGSCTEADVKLLDSEIYKSTGERVYLPVLQTTGESDAYGFNLRIKNKVNQNLNVYHTVSVAEEEVNLNFVSPILYTTDSFLRGIRINGVRTGDLLDSFRNELPQQTPWKERIYKYSANLTYGLTESIALTSRLSLIQVSRSNYEPNPNKEDYDSNQLLDLGFFYEPQKNFLIYGRVSLSSKYLVGVTPIAYNRKSNHLFDHPFGQLYIGTLIRF